MITTTLKNICLKFSSDEWEKLDNELSKTTGNGRLFSFDEPFPLAKIVEINGLECAINAWELQQQYAPEQRLFAVFCARLAHQPITALGELTNVAERFANGDVTRSELVAARLAVMGTNDAARDAALSAALCTSRHDAGAALSETVYYTLKAMPELEPVLITEFIRICNETEERASES